MTRAGQRGRAGESPTVRAAAGAGPGAPAPSRRVSLRTVVAIGAGLSLLFAGLVSWFASSRPDGLEFVAERLGFDSTAGDHALADSPLADYAVRGLGDGGPSTGLAGILGVALVALLMIGLVRLLRRPGRPRR